MLITLNHFDKLQILITNFCRFIDNSYLLENNISINDLIYFNTPSELVTRPKYYDIFIVMALKLASGSYDNTIRFWDPSNSSSNPSETIKLTSAPNRIEITEDKSKIVIGMNNCAKIYDLKRP